MRCYHARNEKTGTTHAVVSASGYKLLGSPYWELRAGLGGGLRSLCGWQGSEGSKTFFKNGTHTLQGVTCKSCRKRAGAE